MDDSRQIQAVICDNRGSNQPVTGGSNETLLSAPTGPKGVGGWLAFFCIGLTVLGPMSWFGQMIGWSYVFGWDGANRVFSEVPSLRTVLLVEGIGSLALTLYGFLVGCSIWSGNPSGRKIARRYLVIRLVGSLGLTVVVAIMLTATLPREMATAGANGLPGALFREGVFCVIWWLYFENSRRVRNTYGDESLPIEAGGGSQNMSLTPNPGNPREPAKEPCCGPDERITAVAVVAPAVAVMELADDKKWHFIHAGREQGPMSRAELIDRVRIGELESDDLVREMESLWLKAKDVEFLQQLFPIPARDIVRETIAQRLGRIPGIWLLRRNFVVGGSVLLFSVVAVFVMSRPSRIDRIRSIRLEPGLSMADVERQLGKPDEVKSFPADTRWSEPAREQWLYSPFGTANGGTGYRLRILFEYRTTALGTYGWTLKSWQRGAAPGDPAY